MSSEEQLQFKPPPSRRRSSARWVGLFADHGEVGPAPKRTPDRPHVYIECKTARADDAFFLAYARADLRQIKPLIESATEDGHAFWIDPAGVGPGASPQAEIARAIRSCSAMVAFCSRHSMASPDFLRQVALASRLDKPVLPVMLDSASPPEALLYHVSLRQMLHASDPDWRYEFNRALDTLVPVEENDEVPVRRTVDLGAAAKQATVNAGLMACAAALAMLLFNVLGAAPTRGEMGAINANASPIESIDPS